LKITLAYYSASVAVVNSKAAGLATGKKRIEHFENNEENFVDIPDVENCRGLKRKLKNIVRHF
jgi:hypothetical protein